MCDLSTLKSSATQIRSELRCLELFADMGCVTGSDPIQYGQKWTELLAIAKKLNEIEPGWFAANVIDLEREPPSGTHGSNAITSVRLCE